MKHEFWTVAYRRRQDTQTLLDNHKTPFRIIPNTWRYWAADPHLYDDGENTWVFAELYDRILRRGVIGCCQISEQGSSPWKVVLKRPYHLSYPHLVTHDNELYMIPESYVADKISVFRATRFPDAWEEVTVLKHGDEPVDSTVVSINGHPQLLTMLLKNGKDVLTLYPLTKEGLHGEGTVLREGDPQVRPAGHLFRADDKWIRPAQDCSESYGCALNLYEVTAVSEECYEERLLYKLHPTELSSNLSHKPAGIHTYNLTSRYEVVDFKGYEKDHLFYIMRPFWFVWRRLRKVLGK